MSNNLVSETMPSMQMAQLQPIVNKADSSGRQMDVRFLGPVSGDPMSQQQAASNGHVGILRAGPGEPRSRGLPISVVQSGRVEPQMINMGPRQLMTTPKRKAPMELSSNGSVTSNKRVAQEGNRPWLQQGSNTSNKGSAQTQSHSNASRTQYLAAPSKRKTQTVTESAPSKSGTPRSSNSKSQNTQMKQSSKVQTESSESVRSKMRESLASALALVSKQDKPLATNNSMLNEAASTQDTAPDQRLDTSQPITSSFAAAGSVDHVTGEQLKSTTSNEDFSEKFKDFEVGPPNVLNNENILGSMEVLNYDKQDFQSSYTLTTDDVPFSDSFFVKDDLLQGHGLSWVLSDVVGMDNQMESQTVIEPRLEPEEIGGGCMDVVPSPEVLASRIEEELFKLFGGANKKYKEKGRSLLFNLKDRNNPELRERVMSGEIPPERLCSMTAEELASKELSEWRIAKAEEFAQMVVLPDSDINARRLVKKTHKGEFQVEVEHEDNVSVQEVSGGTPSVVRSQTIKKDREASSSSKPDVVKGNENTDGEKSNLQKGNSFSITISSNDGTDPMQGLMADDDALKDLPPIVSLDEFMESLHSEPPFGSLPSGSGKVAPVSNKDNSEVGSNSKSSDITPREQADVTSDKSGKLRSTCTNPDAEGEKRVNAESGAVSSDTRCSESQADMKPTNGQTKDSSTDDRKSASRDAELRTSHFPAEERDGNNVYSETALPIKGECIWEGMLQSNIASTHSVLSIFKSGEKTSAKDWPGFLEIKGRVRLDAFEKFLQDLRQSRSRAIMVLHFLSKGSSPNQQSSLREVAESYITDERVGFAEPMQGVELYVCPPHKKTVEMLSKILPKEQTEAVNSIDNGLIGVIVWRKTSNLTSISPTDSSHHKHTSSSKRQQYFSRGQKDTTNVNANPSHTRVPPTGPPACDDDDDDVPPGFGPPAARAEDDLPEFNFSGGLSTSSRLVKKPMLHPVNQVPSRPVDQMRELVHKYGSNKANVAPPSVNWQDKFGGSIQPWNDDDDDIPEWQPQQNAQQNHVFPPQVAAMHNFHLRRRMLNQSSFPGSPHHQQYLQAPLNVPNGQRNFGGSQWGPSTTTLENNNMHQQQQQSSGQHYGSVWPPNVARSSRGF